MTQTDSQLTPDEIEVFARGLYHLAKIDGIDAREQQLIQEFLQESGSPLNLKQLEKLDFNPHEAAQILEASYLRRIFIKVAVALVKADGVYSDQERHALGEIADVFGLSNTEFGDLEQEASRISL